MAYDWKTFTLEGSGAGRRFYDRPGWEVGYANGDFARRAYQRFDYIGIDRGCQGLCRSAGV